MKMWVQVIGQRRKKGQQMCLFVYTWEITNFSCKLLHHSNDTASNLPENTKPAFNQVIKLHKFIVKLLKGWKFSHSPSFSVQSFCFVLLEGRLEKQHFYRRTARFLTFSSALALSVWGATFLPVRSTKEDADY